LNNENVFVVLKRASELKRDVILSMCMEYAHFHVRDLIKMKKAAEDLGIVLFHQVAKLSLQPPPEHATPEDPCPPSTYVDDFKRLYEKTVQKPDQHMQFITCKSKQIRFHSPILAAASPKLTRLLSKELEEDLSKPLLDITPLQVASVHTLLKYLYYGEFE
jgi:BTB/POZ domain